MSTVAPPIIVPHYQRESWGGREAQPVMSRLGQEGPSLSGTINYSLKKEGLIKGRGSRIVSAGDVVSEMMVVRIGGCLLLIPAL